MIVGAGAAGLMAAIACGRARPGRRVVVLDGARSLGAKILVAGGGRCNVTHVRVGEDDFNGSSRPAIRKVLRRFGVEDVVAFFRAQGVDLVREDTGKLFPATHRARTVLDALLRAAADAGASVRFPRRVDSLEASPGGGFRLAGSWGSMAADRVVLCTGGRSLPKSGSDGHGLEIVRRLGHSITPLVMPALVPLVLEPSCVLRSLPGIATDVALDVVSGQRRLARVTGALLCTHFGVSGPAVLDVSRHFLHARADDPGARLVASFAPALTLDAADAELLAARAGAARTLQAHVPERLARALCESAGVEPGASPASLSRERRRGLAALLTQMTLPVTGDRGWSHAEVTAGGVPLREVRLETMESRVVPGLFLAGEILDVDGRIGGFNFQWAWASGHVAGSSA